MARPLDIGERAIGPVTILELSGRLVVDEGDAAFRERVDQLVEVGRVHLLVDLGNVNYIDSGGVGVLVAKYLKVKQHGGQMKLLRLSSRACRVLSITHLLSVFETFDDEANAIRSFQSGALIAR